MRWLQDNATDLAIMGRPPPELGTTAEPLAYHPHVIVAPLAHPLRHARRFDLQELAGDTFLLREPGSGTRAVAEHMFRQHLFVPARSVTLGSNETIKQAVMAGMGVSLISLHTLALELRTGEIALLDVNGTPIERTWQLVHLALETVVADVSRFPALSARTRRAVSRSASTRSSHCGRRSARTASG